MSIKVEAICQKERKNIMSNRMNKYKTVASITTELINLESILKLPKPTEAFMSDIHGEFNAFQHVVRNGSGNVKSKIRDCFQGELTNETLTHFAFLVYYPSEQLTAVTSSLSSQELHQWYLTNVQRLIRLLGYTASKYTRSKLRKAINPAFVYVTEELLYSDNRDQDKQAYYWAIIENLIELGQVDSWIKMTCATIQHLTVDHIHIVGDIYDRGPAPDKIVDVLIDRQSVDFQWGNHDILWLGGAAGSAICICNLIRICARYNNLTILEDAYGINLRHLARFAERYYQDNLAFRPKSNSSNLSVEEDEAKEITKIHQAISIIQFKLEGAVLKRRPEFNMEKRLLLDKISADRKYITLLGHNYTLSNTCFQLVDVKNPYALTDEEQAIIDKLVMAFTHSEKLQRHMKFLMSHGSMYLRYNNNLLIHGCVPTDEQGNFIGLILNGHEYVGPELFDFLEQNLRDSYSQTNRKDNLSMDLLWYMWAGPNSPLFGKQNMTTFERYFIADKATHHENPNPYYQLRHNEKFVRKLLGAFGLDPDTSHVVNGHTPVKKGTSPIMANKKMVVIDGGFSRPYQKVTGIGGYTLLDNSFGMQLVTHEPFISKVAAIRDLTDIVSTKRVVETEEKRRTVAETDIGREIQVQIKELKQRLQELKK